jgi:hypothetical protein
MSDRDREWAESLLTEEPMCRLATVNRRGPHITPVGFLWDGSFVWIASQVQSQRFVDVQRDSRVALVVEPSKGSPTDGYIELIGEAAVVGTVPCMGADDPELEGIEHLWNEKLGFPLELVYDGLHAWVRITPRKVIRAFAHKDDDAYREASQASIEHIERRQRG